MAGSVGTVRDGFSANTLFRGERWAEAVRRVNRRVLVPDRIRGADGKLVERVHDGDRAIAAECKLRVFAGPDADGRAVHQIHVPDSARIVPGSRSPSPGDVTLFRNAQLLAHAASLGTASVPDVLGVMVGETREVFMHSFLVRLIQVLVTLKLGPSINAQLPHTVLAYRPIDGVRTGLHIARALMRRGFDWGARADIKAFFPSIRTRHVEIALPRLVPIQDTMLQLLSWMMSAPIVRGLDHPLVASGVAGVRSEALHALYQGSSVAPLLSNGVGAVCFDIPFALEMKQAAVLLRYADDLLILARDPRVARAGMDLVHALAEVWGFRVHDDPVKTSREPVDLRKDSFTWLGYELGRGGVTLPNAKFVDTVASLAALDPWDRRVRGTFIEAVMKLAFDGGARLDDLRESAAMVSDAHFMAVESAIAHVKENIRTGWIARWQRFAAPVLEEVSG